MIQQERVRIFDSQGEAYKQAFQIFLDHTDQKRNAKRWLQQVVDRLPERKVFIDASELAFFGTKEKKYLQWNSQTFGDVLNRR